MKTATTVVVFAVGALLSLGLVMLYSAGLQPGAAQGGARYLLMQLVWAGIGLAGCVTAVWLDYRWLKKLAWAFLGVAIVLLVLVLLPGIGSTRNGAQRWFDFGMASFQPSEAAKLALIMALARYGEQFQREMGRFWIGLIVPGMLVAVVLGLIFVEPDRGTTVLLAAVSGVMLLMAGVRWLYIVPPVILAAVGLAFSLLSDPVRRTRIMVWLNPEQHQEGVGWQSAQAIIALGSGGWTGLGLGNGRQKLGFVPEHHTDFILSVIGEELGLIATMSVVVLFVMLVIGGAYIAWNARDTFGALLAGGITFLIGLQAFINVGVVTAALPNKGLPLPFISYGGSNLLLMLVCIGILLSVARHAAVREGAPSEEFAEMPVSQFS